MGGLSSSLANAFAASKRAALLLVFAAPLLATLAVIIWLEVLTGTQRVLRLHSRTSRATRGEHVDGGVKGGPVAWLLSPAAPCAWLSWWSSSVLTPRVHNKVPLVALFVRWVTTCRPDLALRPWILRSLTLLREEEHPGPGGRTGGRSPADKTALEHVHSSLTQTLGEMWPQGMFLDPVAISSDCVVETYSAVLREDLLTESQQERNAPKRSLPMRALGAFGLFLTCRRRRRPSVQSNPAIAESAEARRAVVRVRRKGVAETSGVDLRLARWLLAFLARLGFCGPRAKAALEDFAAFVASQLDLRNEAHLLQLGVAALPRGSARVCFPCSYGEPAAEVLIVTFEEGICMAEVFRRRHAQTLDDADALARVAAASELTRVFWTMAYQHRLVLGGASLNNLLLRSVGCGSELEVVSLRCGLAHEIDEQTRDDIGAFATCLTEHRAEMLGPLLLERVHLSAGGALGAVRDVDAFAAGVRELATSAALSPRKSIAPTQNPGALRGTALLQQALALAQRHGVEVGSRHLQFAASAAAVHGVCAQLDPSTAGQPLRNLQAAVVAHLQPS